mmetsp:Transcript_4532/g.19291  ORF Transcript_4532/g.19291 Transcript_4532/m.19291 type:complete len:251 (-) Transcript_4532:107-859(-)
MLGGVPCRSCGGDDRRQRRGSDRPGGLAGGRRLPRERTRQVVALGVQVTCQRQVGSALAASACRDGRLRLCRRLRLRLRGRRGRERAAAVLGGGCECGRRLKVGPNDDEDGVGGEAARGAVVEVGRPENVLEEEHEGGKGWHRGDAVHGELGRKQPPVHGRVHGKVELDRPLAVAALGGVGVTAACRAAGLGGSGRSGKPRRPRGGASGGRRVLGSPGRVCGCPVGLTLAVGGCSCRAWSRRCCCWRGFS